MGEQTSYLKNRHRLLAEMERLHGDYSVPIKQLAGTELAELSTHQLKRRIEYIETIRRLEPEGQRASIKSLRERARLRQRVEQVEAQAGDDFFGQVSGENA